MQLIFISLWSCTALKVTNIRPLIGYNKGTFKLTRTLRIYSKGITICRCWRRAGSQEWSFETIEG